MTTSPKRRRTEADPLQTTGDFPKATMAETPASKEEPVAKQAKKAHNTNTEENLQALGDVYQYKSNIFKMEMKEMLSEVRINYKKRMAPAEKILHLLKGVIDNIPQREGITVEAADKEMKKRKVHIPYPDPRPTEAVQYKFAYQKPTYINVVGSYALKTLIKQQDGVAIDLVLTMPGSIFTDKDYLNYRYFHKRAYYLSVLAASIAGDKSTQGLKLSYEFMNDDHLRPILAVSSGTDGSETDFKGSKCTIRIIPSAPAGQFSANKLAPSKCGIRNMQGLSGNATTQSFDATPFYNSSVASDSTYFPYLALLGTSSKKCEAFTDACIFGRVWLRQRGFGGSISKGGFGHFEWAILMAFLLKSGGPKGRALLTQGYSDYQLFKATLQFLASRNLASSPLIINDGPSELERPEQSIPVVYDGEHGVNVLFKMTASSYELLQHEAAITLECLSKSTLTDQFDSVFLYRVDNPCYRYDAVAQLSLPTKEQLKVHSGESKIDDRSAFVRYTHQLYNVIKKGLGDRQTGVYITCPRSETLTIAGVPTVQNETVITVGLLFDDKNLDRKTDRGPSPEEKKKAAAFQKFWGEIAELRRFPDSTIVESVTWQTKGTKSPIYQQIVKYLVNRHFGIEAVQFSERPLDHLIQGSRQANASFGPVLSAYDTFENDLKALTGLPLSVRHISPAGSALRYASVEISMDSDTKITNPIDVVVQFESSGRWPDDLAAIQNIKTSFLIKAGELLEEHKGDEIIARVGLENADNTLMNNSFLDVVYTTGAAFRLRIHHDREPSLLGKLIVDPESTPKERDATMQALAEHRRTFTLRPRHTGLIRKLCMRYSSLSPTIRLTKKWFHAHMLSTYVPEELIELLVVRSYLQSFPWSLPTTVLTGFLRTLQFLSTWDWTAQPLIVDMSEGDLKTPEYEHIQQTFQNARKTDPAMHSLAMFVATNYDQEDSLWTERTPSRVVAARITSLAKHAVETLDSKPCEINITNIFTPSVRDYDFVLHISPRFLPASSRQAKHTKPTVSKFKNLALDVAPVDGLQISEQDVDSLLDVDIGRDFLAEISSIYKDTLVLFRDAVGGTVISGVWCPHSVKNWKPYISYSTIPRTKKSNDGESKKVETVLNKVAILNEIARIGGDIVTKIEVIKE